MSGWDNSDRRARLPDDWRKRRAAVLARDPMCRLAGPACTGRSTEADHVIPNDDHALSNLQGLCATCHQRKTLAERRQRPRTRPRESHPGIMAPGGDPRPRADGDRSA